MNCGVVRTTYGGWTSCGDELGASCTPSDPHDKTNGYRLTVDDEQRAMVRIGEAVHADGCREPETLQRLGAHAIGCTLHDLRVIERAWLADVTAWYLDTCSQPCTFGAWGDRCALPAGHPGDHHRDHAAHTRAMP